MPTQSQRLIYAVRTRNYERLRKFIREYNGISIVSAAGCTALHAAAEEGDVEAVRILIDAGADVNARMRHGKTPLHLAAAFGEACDPMDRDADRRALRTRRNRRRRRCRDAGIAKILMEIIKEKEPELISFVEPFDPVPEEEMPALFVNAVEFLSKPTLVLHEFVSRGIDLDRLEPNLAEQLRGNPRFLRVVELLLDNGADVAGADDAKTPVLRGTVEWGTPEMVELLIKRGANPNALDSAGSSLIEIALERCLTGIADVLLKHVAAFDPNANEQLHAAAANARLNVLLWLLDQGADINAGNKNGDSALHVAAGHTEVFTALLARGANAHTRNNCGESVLHAAAPWHSCLEMVLPLGLPIDEQNEKGRTALHLAANSGNVDSVKMLLRAGASINVQDHAGGTPLQVAANSGNVDSAKMLLRAGASVNVQDHTGGTPLHAIFDTDECRPDCEFPMFHALVSAGADRSLKNRENKTAFDLAVQLGYPKDYLDLLDPTECRDPKTFICAGDERCLGFLPNAAVSFQMDGVLWPSCAHYFHAQKTTDPEIREKIRQVATADAIPRRLHDLKVEPSRAWPNRCGEIMRSASSAKFRQHHDLRQKLLATGNATLICEPDCVAFWTELPGSGFNAIGKMLMDIRSQVRAESL